MPEFEAAGFYTKFLREGDDLCFKSHVGNRSLEMKYGAEHEGTFIDFLQFVADQSRLSWTLLCTSMLRTM